MAPPRKHETDVILDAARALVLDGGPRAASVAAIAKASGAPAGTLYHRFGNRDGILTAAWLRALRPLPGAGAGRPTAIRRWRPPSRWPWPPIGFARDLPEDARLLLTIRPGDLLDDEPDAAFQQTLAAMNAPLTERVRSVGPATVREQRRAVR